MTQEHVLELKKVNNMTNEEKARELAHFILYDKSYESTDRNIFDKCIEMAKWKEEQFKQYLLQKRIGIGYRSDDIGKCAIVCTQLLNEIIKDLGL